ncbi:hypothetical protein CPA40_03245 [Bifidobacterium callitrichos]|uniref:DUF4037 domain-containing protein n=1 Tax=Bifidobacterium callitrichos TaxID=762209 RepID=A0A2T3GBX5_9BIFI|nr:DUF4037 domain-containing protein [Bifidobacterium callitrichos]PST46980.1 hypothetical protein CPA40_03245 [Bifidobacterium callitrichos]
MGDDARDDAKDALAEQLLAAFAGGDPDDADDEDDAGEGVTDAEQSPAMFDTQEFLKGLDAIFEAHDAAGKAGPYLQQAMVDAENAGDDAGLLTVLNETMGFYRSQGRHEENQWIVQRAIELALRMGLEGSEAWATTLINCATAMRAAKHYDQAEDLYKQALACAEKNFDPKDRRLAALHNNLSMLYSETDRIHQAELELREALRVIESSSVNPDADVDVASSHTNLALVLLQEGKLEGADWHASKALEIYATGHLEHSAHYASALAGLAQVRYAEQRYADAVEYYRRSLAVIEECYGRDTDYYRITKSNLDQAEAKAGKQAGADTTDTGVATKSADAPEPSDATENGRSDDDSENAADSAATQTAATASPAICGLKLARAYWEEIGKPMIRAKYPEYAGRIAAGLVGHGSECYGFDDKYSRDHDFGPRFCLWLTDEDYAAIGERLQADYEALPADFRGFTRAGAADAATPRAQGAFRRDGVFRIGDFFESITGYAAAPAADAPHEWMLLDEATLAAATNGEVFADPLGAFSKARQAFKDMPDDVRYALVSKRLGMIAQAGQYNLARSLKRGDGDAAWMSIHEFVDACSSLVFLINKPLIVGYAPYYKWRFAALRRLSGRMFTLLPDVCERLETVMRLSSAACYGGAGFGEGGKGSAPAAERIESIVESIARDVVRELRREGLTTSDETFLEWQRPYVEEHIGSDAPCLHSL